MARNYYELKTSYNYNELSSDAKERVAEWLNADGYVWSGDALLTIKTLAEHFGGKITDWSIDWSNPSSSSVEFSMPEIGYWEFSHLLSELGAVSAETGKGVGDCKLTGVCFDEDAVDGLRAAFASLPVPSDADRFDEDGQELDDWGLIGSDDVSELMQAAWWELALACRDDYESQWGEEYVADMCEANGYQFFANGDVA